MRDRRIERGMLRVLTIVLLLVSVTATAAAAQQSDDVVLDELRLAIAEGDVDRFLGHTSDRVDVTILGASDIFSRSQARYVVEAFFKQFPPERFTLEKPTRRESNCFASGTYGYRHGRTPLRIHLRLRRAADEWKLRELRVERRSPR